MSKFENKAGLFLTPKSSVVVEQLEMQRTAIIPFADGASGMWGWFSFNLNLLANLKARGLEQAFVTTTDQSHIDELIDNNPLIASMPVPVKLRVTDFMHSTIQAPIGMLLPYSGAEVEHHRIGSILIGGDKIVTWGVMRSGATNEDFPEVIAGLGKKFIPGSTSANQHEGEKSPKRARGSGHTSLFELVRDFRSFLSKDAQVTVKVPKRHQIRSGASTTVAYVGADGNARLVREGSIPKQEMISLLEKSGLPYVGEVDHCRKIQPFLYDTSRNAVAMRNLLDYFLVKVVNMTGGFRIPLSK